MLREKYKTSLVWFGEKVKSELNFEWVPALLSFFNKKRRKKKEQGSVAFNIILTQDFNKNTLSKSKFSLLGQPLEVLFIVIIYSFHDG